METAQGLDICLVALVILLLVRVGSGCMLSDLQLVLLSLVAKHRLEFALARHAPHFVLAHLVVQAFCGDAVLLQIQSAFQAVFAVQLPQLLLHSCVEDCDF